MDDQDRDDQQTPADDLRSTEEMKTRARALKRFGALFPGKLWGLYKGQAVAAADVD